MASSPKESRHKYFLSEVNRVPKLQRRFGLRCIQDYQRGAVSKTGRASFAVKNCNAGGGHLFARWSNQGQRREVILDLPSLTKFLDRLQRGRRNSLRAC